MNIHPTAIVAPGAQIPASCTIGPFCTIGPNVMLGEECVLISHVVLDGHLTVGRGNRIFPFASIGVAPQDLKYAGEPTRCVLGDNNTIPRNRRWRRSHPHRLRLPHHGLRPHRSRLPDR